MRTTVLPLLFTVALSAQVLPVVSNVEHQPLAAQVLRLIEALDVVGEPLPATEGAELRKLAEATSNKPAAVAQIQKILDRHCLVGVNINPESRVKAQEGPAKPELVEQGWRQFLVKVVNESGTTAALRAVSPNAIAVYSDEHGGPKSSPSDRFYREKSKSLTLTDNAQL